MQARLLAKHETADVGGATGGAVAGDQGAAKLGVALGGFELARHAGKEALQNELGFDANDGVIRAAHANVGLIGRSGRQDALVRGRDMGVGAKDCGDAAIEVPAKGDLLTGGLGMEVKEDDPGARMLRDGIEQIVRLTERVVAGAHEDAALQVQDGIALPCGELALIDAEARGAHGVVGRPQHPAATLVGICWNGHVVEDFALVPDVVAGGDDMGPEVEEFFGDRWRDAEAARSVFAVDDKEVDGMGFQQMGQMLVDDVAAGGAKDVANEEDVHRRTGYRALYPEVMIEMQYNFPLLPGLPAAWRERLRRAVDALGDEDYPALRPTFRSPQPALKQVAATWLRVPEERLWLTDGAHHGCLIAMMAAGLAGKPVAMDAAAYTGALEQARALACPIVGCAVDAEGMTAASLRLACTRGRDRGEPVAAIFATVTVHNPLGCTASLARRRELIEAAREFDLLILEDDTYGFMEPEAPDRLYDLAPERTFYVGSLSKSYVPASRMGFLVAPERFDAGIAAAVKNTATGSSLVHHVAACSLLADGSVDRVIAAKNREGSRRNAAARAVLGARCWPGAPAAWHLWVALPKHVRAEAFEATMRDRGVCLSGGNWFATCDDAPHGFRMALGGEVDAALTQRGVEMVAEALQTL